MNIKRTYSLVALGAVLLLALALILITDWNPLWIWLAAVNLVAFIAYGLDKARAKNGGMRIPELVLHGLALTGGFLGAWIGRYYFRHKTQKPVFSVVLVISTLLWVVIIYLFGF